MPWGQERELVLKTQDQQQTLWSPAYTSLLPLGRALDPGLQRCTNNVQILHFDVKFTFSFCVF